MAAYIWNERVLLLTDFFLIFVKLLVLFNIVVGESLYKDEDPMVQLNNDTIYSHLEDSNKVWMVEFYSSWCGHCQSFAPKWVNFSWEVNNWRKYADIGVLNCAEERNFETCVEFGIDMYPTIKFFNINWKRPPKEKTEKLEEGKKEKRKLKEKSNRFGVTYDGDKQIKLLKRGLINHIEKQKDVSLPSEKLFEFASTDVITSAIKTPPKNFDYLIVIFEKPDSYIGKNLILDTSQSTIVLVLRTSSLNVDLMRDYKITAQPAALLVELKKQDTKVIQPKNSTYNSFVEAINKVEKLIELPNPSLNKEKSKNKKADPKIDHEIHPSELNINDLHSAISYSLRREVPKKPVLENQQLEALKHWVILLWKCVPLEKEIRTFLGKLNGFLDKKEDSLTSKEYLTFLDSSKGDDSFLPTEINWTACKGSENKYRGFPCGLWTLFHSITVTCAKKNLAGIPGLNVVIGIRDFVDYFFGCQHCRNHFMKMASSMRSEVSSHDDAIIWLWKSHNKVNARLRNDISSDPVYPKVQFPSEDMCAECSQPTDKENTMELDSGFGTGKIKWNSRMVLEFLKEHYSPDNIRVKYPLDVQEADSVRRRPNRFTYRFYPRKGSSTKLSFIGLTQLDISMCMVLYFIVIVTLIMLYLYFLRYRKKKEFKHYV